MLMSTSLTHQSQNISLYIRLSLCDSVCYFFHRRWSPLLLGNLGCQKMSVTYSPSFVFPDINDTPLLLSLFIDLSISEDLSHPTESIRSYSCLKWFLMRIPKNWHWLCRMVSVKRWWVDIRIEVWYFAMLQYILIQHFIFLPFFHYIQPI